MNTQRIEGIVEKSSWAKPRQDIHIYNPENNKVFIVRSGTYLKVMKGDAISGEVNSYYEWIDPKRVQIEPFANRDGILNCLKLSIGGRKGQGTLLKIYANLERQSSFLSMDIATFLTEYTMKEEKDDSFKVISQFSELVGIDAIEGSHLLSWWRKNYCLRRLLLLGCQMKEIRESVDYWYNLDELYTALTTNPFLVLPVAWETCLRIAEERMLTFINEKGEEEYLFESRVKEHALQMRKYDQISKASGHTALQIKGEKKNYTHLEQYGCKIVSLQKEEFNTTFLLLPHMVLAYEILQKKFLSKKKVQLENYNLELKEEKIILNECQQRAVEMGLKEKHSCIRGGAGTGKTTIISSIVSRLQKQEIPHALLAFTGKATSRMNFCLKEISEGKAITIHSFLLRRDRSKYKYLIIDEASMVSTILLARLVRQLSSSTRIILIGDEHQLPPIDQGSPFIELLSILPSVSLTIDCRRVKHGNLYWNLKHIRTEDFTSFSWEGDEEKDDMHFLEGDETTVVQLLEMFQQQGKSDTDVTVVTPYRESVEKINHYAHQIWNPNNFSTVDFRKREWRVGDRIMMLENQSDINVMNGEEGRIVSIAGNKLLCNFDLNVEDENAKVVEIPLQPNWKEEEKETEGRLSTDCLSLSWAITVHKSQGSQWKNIIFYIPPGKSPGNFLSRKLTYTALSRASEKLFCVAGSYETLAGSIILNSPPRLDPFTWEEKE